MTIGKSKLAEMAWSDSLAPWPLVPAPRFVNNGYVTAETTYALHRHVMRHAPGQGWRAARLYELPHGSPGRRRVGATVERQQGRVTRGSAVAPFPLQGRTAARPGHTRLCCGSVPAALWLCGDCCYRCRASRERANCPQCLGSSGLLPGAQLRACLLWAQQTGEAVRTARRLAESAG